MPTPKKHKTTLKLVAFLAFGGALSLAIVIAHLSLAQATITVTAAKIPLYFNGEITIPLTGALVAHQENEQKSAIKTLREMVLGTQEQSTAEVDAPLTADIESTTVSLDHTATPSAEGKKIPSKATGNVIIYNELSYNQPLVTNTRLLSDKGILFRTTKRVVVPAVGNIAIQVIADKEGEEGNIQPSAFTIPGLSPEKQKFIYAKSSAPMSGGVQIIKVLSEDDFKKAEQEAIEMVKEQALQFFNKQELTVTPRQLVLSDIKISSPDKPGEEKEKFTTSITATAHAVLINPEALYEEAKARLQTQVASPYKIIAINDESLTYEITALQKNENQVTVMTHLEGFKTIQSNSADASAQNANVFIDTRELVGLTAEKIQAKLLKNEAVQEVTVQFSPFWVTRAPRRVEKITIVIK